LQSVLESVQGGVVWPKASTWSKVWKPLTLVDSSGNLLNAPDDDGACLRTKKFKSEHAHSLSASIDFIDVKSESEEEFDADEHTQSMGFGNAAEAEAAQRASAAVRVKHEYEQDQQAPEHRGWKSNGIFASDDPLQILSTEILCKIPCVFDSKTRWRNFVNVRFTDGTLASVKACDLERRIIYPLPDTLIEEKVVLMPFCACKKPPRDLPLSRDDPAFITGWFVSVHDDLHGGLICSSFGTHRFFLAK